MHRNTEQIQLNIMNFVACRFKCIMSNVPTVKSCFKFKKFQWHRGHSGILHSEHWKYQSTQWTWLVHKCKHSLGKETTHLMRKKQRRVSRR